MQSQARSELRPGIPTTGQHGIPLRDELVGYASPHLLTPIFPVTRWSRARDVKPEDIEATIYRLVQEATNNAIKHAEPRRISVSTMRRPATAILRR